jgi:hypothetical protein
LVGETAEDFPRLAAGANVVGTKPMVQLDPPKKMSHQSPAKLNWTLQAVAPGGLADVVAEKDLPLHLL